MPSFPSIRATKDIPKHIWRPFKARRDSHDPNEVGRQLRANATRFRQLKEVWGWHYQTSTPLPSVVRRKFPVLLRIFGFTPADFDPPQDCVYLYQESNDPEVIGYAGKGEPDRATAGGRTDPLARLVPQDGIHLDCLEGLVIWAAIVGLQPLPKNEVRPPVCRNCDRFRVPLGGLLAPPLLGARIDASKLIDILLATVAERYDARCHGAPASPVPE